MSKAPPRKRDARRRLTALTLTVAAGWLLAGATVAPAQEVTKELKPPFGLTWGESMDKLERLLNGAKAKIVDRRMVAGDREAWEVEGLVQTGLRRTIFYFRRGEM